MKTLSTILLTLILTNIVQAKSTHTWDPKTNLMTTVCDLGSLKLTFEYPNPAGSSNYTPASKVKLVATENGFGPEVKHNLVATQFFLSRFYGPESYGDAVSALFVNDDAEIVIAMNSTSQTLRGMAAGPYEHAGVCLFNTGE